MPVYLHITSKEITHLCGAQSCGSWSRSFHWNSTNGFSDERKISEGAFGTVYRGILQDGQVIAVKKLAGNTIVPAGQQFKKEATNLIVVRHENIQKLLSYCSEAIKNVVEHKGKYILVDTDECILCYEYAPKGSLREYLADASKRTNSTDDSKITDWDTNFKIIKGICQGLLFLHQGMGAPIVHLDLQPANILLDDNMVPKIADFGLSRLFGQEQTRIRTTNVVGAKGYMAPEYVYNGEISPQCDIYSLGVVMLEIITGEKNCSVDKDMSSSNFAIDIRKTWTEEYIVSKYSFLEADRLQQVRACIEVAFRCVDISQKNRPSIEEVVKKLNDNPWPFQKHREVQMKEKMVYY
ncbi:hypothetical protein U9M48_004169 [Paspalum notatum var. saurae]|uniref:Protein kinase domain-containing protein n=1 Tax=Paspalum notatum var. saurae TaxID=547442 RepID=A0AAQ3PMF1_PASNO